MNQNLCQLEMLHKKLNTDEAVITYFEEKVPKCILEISQPALAIRCGLSTETTYFYIS